MTTPDEAKKKTVYLLTGDIGGTNARMSLYDAEEGISGKPLVEKYYRNAETIPETERQANTFRKYIVVPFLKHCWETNSDLAPLETVDIIATLATAGVVSNDQVYMTNLGNLFVDGKAIEADTSNPYVKRIVVCRIINDFVAVSQYHIISFSQQSLLTHTFLLHISICLLFLARLRLLDSQKFRSQTPLRAQQR